MCRAARRSRDRFVNYHVASPRAANAFFACKTLSEISWQVSVLSEPVPGGFFDFPLSHLLVRLFFWRSKTFSSSSSATWRHIFFGSFWGSRAGKFSILRSKPICIATRNLQCSCNRGAVRAARASSSIHSRNLLAIRMKSGHSRATH